MAGESEVPFSLRVNDKPYAFASKRHTTFGQNQKLAPHRNPASAEGVEVAGVALHLVGDLPGTGSQISHLGASGTPHAQVLLPLCARSPTSQLPRPPGRSRSVCPAIPQLFDLPGF